MSAFAAALNLKGTLATVVVVNAAAVAAVDPNNMAHATKITARIVRLVIYASFSLLKPLTGVLTMHSGAPTGETLRIAARTDLSPSQTLFATNHRKVGPFLTGF